MTLRDTNKSYVIDTAIKVLLWLHRFRMQLVMLKSRSSDLIGCHIFITCWPNITKNSFALHQMPLPGGWGDWTQDNNVGAALRGSTKDWTRLWILDWTGLWILESSPSWREAHTDGLPRTIHVYSPKYVDGPFLTTGISFHWCSSQINELVATWCCTSLLIWLND